MAADTGTASAALPRMKVTTRVLALVFAAAFTQLLLRLMDVLLLLKLLKDATTLLLLAYFFHAAQTIFIFASKTILLFALKTLFLLQMALFLHCRCYCSGPNVSH